MLAFAPSCATQTENLGSGDNVLSDRTNADILRSSLETRLKTGLLSHAGFHDELAKLEGFEDIEIAKLAKDPGAQVVILFEDRHGDPEVERVKIYNLYSAFGINCVALEGYNGLENGIMNGEEYLTAQLLHDTRFELLGLEDADLQREALELTATKLWLSFMTSQLEAKSLRKVYGDNEESVILETIASDALSSSLFTLNKLGIEDQQEKKDLIMKILTRITGTTRDEMDNVRKNLFASKLFYSALQMSIEKEYIETARIARSIEAVEKFTESNKDQVCSMVFGENHRPSIVRAFSEHDITVFVVPRR